MASSFDTDTTMFGRLRQFAYSIELSIFQFSCQRGLEKKYAALFFYAGNGQSLPTVQGCEALRFAAPGDALIETARNYDHHHR